MNNILTLESLKNAMETLEKPLDFLEMDKDIPILLKGSVSEKIKEVLRERLNETQTNPISR